MPLIGSLDPTYPLGLFLSLVILLIPIFQTQRVVHIQ